MKKNKILLVLISCLTLASCQSLKDGLSGNKSENSDEFLVKKKSPLVLPPKYLELPEPKDSILENEEEFLIQDNLDIQKLLGIEEDNANSSPSKSRDVEEFVLKNIKDN